jgi:hypothetical protein
MENRRRRKKGLFPQPEFRLVTMRVDWSPSDPEIATSDDGRDLLSGFSIADPMTGRPPPRRSSDR